MKLQNFMILPSIGGLAVVAFWRSPHGPLGSGPPRAGYLQRRKRKEKGERADLIFLPRPVWEPSPPLFMSHGRDDIVCSICSIWLREISCIPSSSFPLSFWTLSSSSPHSSSIPWQLLLHDLQHVDIIWDVHISYLWSFNKEFLHVHLWPIWSCKQHICHFYIHKTINVVNLSSGGALISEFYRSNSSHDSLE